MSRADRHLDGVPEHGLPDHRPVELNQVAQILRDNQKLITLGRLAASIAHEINNPLESITNLLYLMEQSKPEKASEYLKLAQRELSRVVQISKQTLTFSRETRGPVQAQLAELIEEVLGLHARRIGDKNLHVVRQYETCKPLTVFPGEMRQVLSNLLSNAVEATSDEGRIVIRIRASRSWTGREARGLRLSIGDDGSGISEEIRNHLGEPFYTTKGQRGTGLGLWVTRSILGRYGGMLQLRSSVSPVRHGTVFSIFLPFSQGTVTMFPGGDAERLPVKNARNSGWRGLRLVDEENDCEESDSVLPNPDNPRAKEPQSVSSSEPVGARSNRR